MGCKKDYIKNLIRKCAEKDLGAWDEFVKFIHPLVYSIISDKFKRLGFKGQRSDIENLRQNILLSIWEKDRLKTIKNEDNITPWIAAFAVHAASNYVKRLKPVDLPNARLFFDDESLISSAPAPLKELSDNELGKDIERALGSLSHKENLIITLSLLYQKKYREIAQILNLPLGTVLVYAKRAKGKLRAMLKDYEKNL